MADRVEFRIEGLDLEGDWHLLDRPLAVQGDHQAHRDHVVHILRQHGMKRYVRVRLVKVITATEVIGAEIPV